MLEGGCRSIEDSEALCYKVVVDPLKIVKHCATRWLVDPLKIVKHCATRYL